MLVSVEAWKIGKREVILPRLETGVEYHAANAGSGDGTWLNGGLARREEWEVVCDS